MMAYYEERFQLPLAALARRSLLLGSVLPDADEEAAVSRVQDLPRAAMAVVLVLAALYPAAGRVRRVSGIAEPQGEQVLPRRAVRRGADRIPGRAGARARTPGARLQRGQRALQEGRAAGRRHESTASAALSTDPLLSSAALYNAGNRLPSGRAARHGGRGLQGRPEAEPGRRGGEAQPGAGARDAQAAATATAGEPARTRRTRTSRTRTSSRTRRTRTSRTRTSSRTRRTRTSRTRTSSRTRRARTSRARTSSRTSRTRTSSRASRISSRTSSSPSEQEQAMSQEEAERLLDAIEAAEEELQAELRAAKAGKREKVDKDW